MHHPIKSAKGIDKHGFPKGATTRSLGISIQWHNGPTERNGKPLLNGANFQTLIDVLVDRLKFVQGTEAAHPDYEKVIQKLEETNTILDSLTPPQHPLGSKKRVHPSRLIQAPALEDDEAEDEQETTEEIRIDSGVEEPEEKPKSKKKK